MQAESQVPSTCEKLAQVIPVTSHSWAQWPHH